MNRAKGLGPVSFEILVKDRQSGAVIVAEWPSLSAENSMEAM
jgi:hypothetical protein